MSKKKIIPVRQMNIVLIGFMGVGKTTIGELIAQKLFREFIDIDQVIERKFNMSIPELFQKKGEKGFREIERDITIDYATNKKMKVLSLGGGAFSQEDIRKACLSKCLVLHIDLSWESWKDRLHLLMDNRPVLQNKELTDIEQLYIQRQEFYSLNNSRVLTDNKEPEEVANYIVDTLKAFWDVYDNSNDSM